MENRMTDHGMVNWIDIVTQDRLATLKFYTNVFGYSTEDMPCGKGPAYTMLITPAGAKIGGVMEADGKEMFQTKLYFTVDDGKATEEIIKALGAKVLMSVQDMGDMGSFGIYEDDAGAVFGTCQPSEKTKKEFDSSLDKGGYAQGVISWFDVLATDTQKAASFYSEVFHYKVAETPEYIMLLSDHAKNSGFGGVTPMAESALQWGARKIKPYITVEDVEKTNKLIVENGGTLLLERFDLPEDSGHFSIALDNAQNPISPIRYLR